MSSWLSRPLQASPVPRTHGGGARARPPRAGQAGPSELWSEDGQAGVLEASYPSPIHSPWRGRLLGVLRRFAGASEMHGCRVAGLLLPNADKGSPRPRRLA
ncbi:hypothetical protein PsYK624_107860 [Phanerochaete sordida]|uniref:Uncharacterized protein n=1 Tax=Phanerochaete sordida TaxID=48140 RepID=A0A9P3LGS4_9APHY|nr:hypothetical protein PsYK624_107860 [Phanerochaete sordida]